VYQSAHGAPPAPGALLYNCAMPDAADDIAADYRAVRAAAGVMDRSDRGVVEVTGRDRGSFLHAMLSNDVKSVAPGLGVSAAFLDVHGKVQVLMDVWALEDRMLIVTPPGMAPATVEALDRYLFSEKAALRDATGEHALTYLAGPGTPALIEQLTGTAWPDRTWANAAGQVGGRRVRVVRGAAEADEPDAWVV
jgi:glycine cleavage system aminomethyltransferase T